MSAMWKEVRKMRIKSFILISFAAVVLVSFFLATTAISSEQELLKELQFFKENYTKAKKVTIGPPGVDELKSGKYPKKVEEKIFDFKKGDVEVYWIHVPINSAHHYVTAEINTVRGAESKYEYVKYFRTKASAQYGETSGNIPALKPEGGRIDYLLLIKRKMAGSRVYNPSPSVETKVTFTYYPK